MVLLIQIATILNCHLLVHRTIGPVLATLPLCALLKLLVSQSVKSIPKVLGPHALEVQKAVPWLSQLDQSWFSRHRLACGDLRAKII
jgi:hypothetical protein